MNRLMQDAVLVGLTRRLAAAGSWTGETHLQKSTYLLADLWEIRFDFDFILYKHGPFSFELRDELAALRADGLIEQFVENPRYGAKMRPTSAGLKLEEQFSRAISRYDASLDRATEVLADRGVKDLERLATAMWMTTEHPGASADDRAAELVKVKPHIAQGSALEAVKEIDELLAAR